MAFRLDIATDNDAFMEDPGGEVARILGDVAAAVEGGKRHGKTFDINGNSVGNWTLE